MTDFTQAQLAALTKAIATGVRFVEQGGKRTQFASITDMLALRDRMIRELEGATDAPKRPLANGSVFLKR
ncbi:phage head-tail joining protein [Methylovirgula sp. 4M-Z18]|uniref:phage head-tail joining protein n=1 Tax=Methylovirgula sp. 4M-Z18 TaxID=2293567 RepID=UPI000E2F26D6|nr:hypothetical protein [Methylovirgula sp. 4M-Z18]RFB80411.1 hypothetical protein DYH55_02465 [Methylovirgula sp. 4M-Z18]